MSNLREGIININGFDIKPLMSVGDVEKLLGKNNVVVSELDKDTTIVRLKSCPEIDGRKFDIKISFENGVLWGINLQVYRPNRIEFDFWEWIAKNRNWFIEQLGKSDGIKEEVIFSWGKASFWVDERSRDGGISIYYAPK